MRGIVAFCASGLLLLAPWLRGEQVSVPVQFLGGSGAPGGNCTIGQLYFQADAAPGQNLWLCGVTGWTQVTGGGGAGAALFSSTGDATVGNTGSEATLVGTGVGSLTLPAGFFDTPGNILVVAAYGYYSTKAAPVGNLTWKLKFDATVIAGDAHSSLDQNESNVYWETICYVAGRTAGVKGTVMTQCNWKHKHVITTEPVIGSSSTPNTSAVVVDTTATHVVDLTAQWATADASNTITGTNFVMYPVAAGTVVAGYQVVRDETVPLTQRSNLNFTGAGVTCTDNGGTGATDCTIPGGGGGGLVLLESRTAAASASLDFTTCISTTYDDYKIEIVGLVPANNGVSIIMRLSTDGGMTYDSGNNYAWGRYYRALDAATSGNSNSSPTNGMYWWATDLANTQVLSGSGTLYAPLNSSAYKHAIYTVIGKNSGAGETYFISFGAVYKVNTAVNAFQFLASAGNLASGSIRCYGVAKP